MPIMNAWLPRGERFWGERMCAAQGKLETNLKDTFQHGRCGSEEFDKAFNKVTAVNSINLEIQDKEFMVLVGPSGCGKTTALRMIAGLEEATGGEIYIGDRLVNDVSPKDRDIAMVFQNYALYPHMSVYDNMSFGLRLKRTPTGGVWPFNSSAPSPKRRSTGA